MTEERWCAIRDWFIIGFGVSMGIGIGGALFLWVFVFP